jgi:hypothetical protein
MGYSAAASGQFDFAPENFTTLAHFSVSSARAVRGLPRRKCDRRFLGQGIVKYMVCIRIFGEPHVLAGALQSRDIAAAWSVSP